MIDDDLIANAIAYMQDDPLDADRRGVLADIIEEYGEPGEVWMAAALRAGRIPLWMHGVMAAIHLGNCRFAPATFDKRFAKDIANLACKPEPSLTPKQYLWLFVLLHRYRKSVLSDRVKKMAESRYDRYIELLDMPNSKRK